MGKVLIDLSDRANAGEDQERDTTTFAEMIDKAETNIRADYSAGKISKYQFQKEMLIVARAKR